MSELTHIEYTRPANKAVTGWALPAHLMHGREAPKLREGEPIPTDIFRFDAKPETVGKAPVAVVKHLLMPYGPGKPGNEHFCDLVARGELRFRRSDLRQLEYEGPVGASTDPLLGNDESGEERAARIEREAKVAEAAAKESVLDKEIELEHLRSKRAEDERATAEAQAKKAELDAKRMETAEKRKAEAAVKRSIAAVKKKADTKKKD